MKIIIGIFLFLLFQACTIPDNKESQLYISDKIHIEHAFVNNVESIRRLLAYNTDGFYLDSRKYDNIPDSLPRYSGGIFWGYAIYWDEEFRKYRAISRPACEWLDVNVESINYSTDSLKCVALLTIADNHDNHENKTVEYDGRALIGFRNSKNDQFKIYPISVVTFHGFPSRNRVSYLLKKKYYNLKGSIRSGAGIPYSCGINDPIFFETAPEFTYIDSLNLYLGETDFISKDNIRPYIFYSNQDSTITKNLCE